MAEVVTREPVNDLVTSEQKAPGTQLVVQRTGPSDLSLEAVPALAAELAHAVREMSPDDLYVEIDGKREGDSSDMRFRFRAYRRSK